MRRNPSLPGLMIAAVGLLVALISFGCSTNRAPDLRPAPPEMVVAHIEASPPITIERHPITLRAWLDDPGRRVRCPGTEWLYPDGTRSYHVGDCNPDDQIGRHYADPRVFRLNRGDYIFRITFDSEGRAWSAETRVEVH